jgi:hypothetical protein
VLFPLFRETGDPRYEQAARRLRDQLLTQPRTRSNGFWHKQIYPYQMWLDGIYMASPFLAEYAATFGEPDIFDDIAHQIMLVARHTRASSSGLHYHAWDESQQQQWADPVTGCSPHFWGRAMGWYMMAIPDVLDYLPENHLQRGEIITVFVRAMAALVAVQDQGSGIKCWIRAAAPAITWKRPPRACSRMRLPKVSSAAISIRRTAPPPGVLTRASWRSSSRWIRRVWSTSTVYAAWPVWAGRLTATARLPTT